jgi:hypothetical protein
METLFLLFKIVFMAVFALSVVLSLPPGKHIDTDNWDFLPDWGVIPFWAIAAAQTPIIILYSLFG